MKDPGAAITALGYVIPVALGLLIGGMLRLVRCRRVHSRTWAQIFKWSEYAFTGGLVALGAGVTLYFHFFR